MADEPPPPAPEKRRTNPQRKMTADQHALLTKLVQTPEAKVNGRIDCAILAKLTGMSYQQIYGWVKKNPYLRAQVEEIRTDKIVPTEADLVDSDIDASMEPPTGVTISNQQMAEYGALLRQQKKMVAADWQALGLDEAGGKRMEAYITLGAAPTGQILRASTGQLISNLDALDQVIKGDVKRILDGNLPAETTPSGDPKPKEQVERQWRHTVYEGMKLQLSMFAHVHKVQALMARVLRDMQDRQNAPPPPPRKGDYTQREIPVTASNASD